MIAPIYHPLVENSHFAQLPSTGLEHLLKTAPPIRAMILSGLSNVVPLDIALSKGTRLQEVYKPNFQAVKKQISQTKLLQEILTDHPTWKKNVESWQNISLEDKIWLLQIYELRDLGVEIPQVGPFLSLDLLRKETRGEIAAILDKVTSLKASGKQLKKCPKAIRLLKNLEKLDLSFNHLTALPDLSHNVKLLSLVLFGNNFSSPPDVSPLVSLQALILTQNALTSPPDVSRNVNLKKLDLYNNKLTSSPDLTHNVNLQDLSLNYNKLTSPPDVRHNLKLKKLSLSCNEFTRLPDFSKNLELEELELYHCNLTTSPDFSQNVNLTRLNLCENCLTAPPNTSKNVNLEHLDLSRNQLKTPPNISTNGKLQRLILCLNILTSAPDISTNGNLQTLNLNHNSLTPEARAALIKIQRKNLTILAKEFKVL